MQKIKKIHIGVFIGLFLLLISSAIFAKNLVTNKFSASLIFPYQGGTGTSTAPSYGQVLVGNSEGTYSLTATSSLNIYATASELYTGTVSTSSTPTLGQLSYWTGTGFPATLGTIATTSLTATWPVSLSQPISVIGSSASALSLSSGYFVSTTTSNTWGGIQTIANASTTNISTTEICFSNGQCMQAPAITGTLITLFHHNTVSEIATYESLFTYPPTGTEVDESCSADADVAGGYCDIDPYVSTTTDLALESIAAGTWDFRKYTYVDSTIDNSKLESNVYKRDASGTETFLFQATSTDIQSTSVVLREYTSAQNAFDLTPTDRIVIKLKGWTDSSNAKVIHHVYGSSARYSRIITPATLTDEMAATYFPLNSWYATTSALQLTNLSGLTKIGTTTGLSYLTGGVLTATTTLGENMFTRTGTWTGNAGTASALFANPSDCSANEFANVIAANGNLTCAAIADADVPDTITASNYLSLTNWFATTTIPHITTAGGLTNATSTNFALTNLFIGSDGQITSLIGDGISITGTTLGFDCSEVTDSASDALTCSSEDLVVDDVLPAMLNASDFGEFTCNGTSCAIDDGISLATITATNASTTIVSGNTICIGNDCQTSWPSGTGAPFAWTPKSIYEEIANSTSTPILFEGSVYASSTIYVASANLGGGLNIGDMLSDTATVDLYSANKNWWFGVDSGDFKILNVTDTFVPLASDSDLQKTTTAGLWTFTNATSTLLTFTDGWGTRLTTTNATSTDFGATRIFISDDLISDFNGTGLDVTAGVLTLNATGDWTGTLDGMNGSLYSDLSWGKTYNDLSLTATTTESWWFKAPIYASSTSFFTGLATLTNASSSLLTVSGASWFSGATATSTFSGGLSVAKGVLFSLLQTCTLKTDGSGVLTCGTDDDVPEVGDLDAFGATAPLSYDTANNTLYNATSSGCSNVASTTIIGASSHGTASTTYVIAGIGHILNNVGFNCSTYGGGTVVVAVGTGSATSSYGICTDTNSQVYTTTVDLAAFAKMYFEIKSVTANSGVSICPFGSTK